MADDQDLQIWGDDDFWEEAMQMEAAVCSSSANPTQPPPRPFLPPPPPPAPHPHAPHINISYSPPRELSQRVKEENHRNLPDKGFDCPVSFNRGLNPAPPFPHSFQSNHEEDRCSEQQEINRLKEELGRVSKVVTNLEQECLELRKDREKKEKHLRLMLPVNGSKDPEPFCTNKSNLKNKDPFEDHSMVHPGTKGVITCKAVGVQTDAHELMIKQNISVTHHSKKLADIWEPGNDQQPRNSLVSKLFLACGADLQVISGCLGLDIPSKKMTTKVDFSKDDLSYMAPSPNHCIQSVEAAKVSHLYLTLTKISYDVGRLDDLLEALVDLCHVQNISLRAACGFETHFEYGKQRVQQCTVLRDNVIVDDHSTSEKHSEVRHLFPDDPHHPVLTRLISAKKVDDSSCLKWFSYFQIMHQIITRHSEENIRVEAVSIMIILLLGTNAYTERQMYGGVAVFETISQLLRKEAGAALQKQTVDLLYFLLNCPNLMLMFCSSCKEEGTSAEVPTTSTETASALKWSGAILDGLADCLACSGNGAPTTLVLKLQRKTIILLSFLASSGRCGFEILLGRNCSRRSNFLFLILQILASEIDVEASECIQSCDDFRERTLVIREALILLNRLASNSQYATTVLRFLTNRRDMACLTIDIASRLSRKSKCLWHESDTTVTGKMRESEIVDLARTFKKRVFSFLGDTIPSEK